MSSPISRPHLLPSSVPIHQFLVSITAPFHYLGCLRFRSILLLLKFPGQSMGRGKRASVCVLGVMRRAYPSLMGFYVCNSWRVISARCEMAWKHMLLCCQWHIHGDIPKEGFKEKPSSCVEWVNEVNPSLRLPQIRTLRILIWSEGFTLKVPSTKDGASECEI